MAQVLGFILVFFCHFGGVDPSSWMTSSIAFWVVFVFFESLDLSLSLSLRLSYINRRRIMTRLSFVTISMVSTGFILLCGSVLFWAPGDNLSYSWWWLKAGFGFYIDGFLYYFFPWIQVISLIIYLYLDEKT